MVATLLMLTEASAAVQRVLSKNLSVKKVFSLLFTLHFSVPVWVIIMTEAPFWTSVHNSASFHVSLNLVTLSGPWETRRDEVKTPRPASRDVTVCASGGYFDTRSLWCFLSDALTWEGKIDRIYFHDFFLLQKKKERKFPLYSKLNTCWINWINCSFTVNVLFVLLDVIILREWYSKLYALFPFINDFFPKAE